MVLIGCTMKKPDNDNEELSFVTLAAATANVTRYLVKEQKPDGDPDREKREGTCEHGKREDHRASVVLEEKRGSVSAPRVEPIGRRLIG